MAAPVYATDLSDILADMASTTGWTALGGGASGLVAPETDFFIQGSNCISKAGWSSAIKGMIYNFGSGVTVPTTGAVLMWIYYWGHNSLDTLAGFGLRCAIGSAASAYNEYAVGGSDTLPFGGWVLAAVDPNTASADATVGSPSGTEQYFGATADVPGAGPSKGQPLGIDAMRYGRCELRCTDGDAGNGYATFAGAQAYGDAVTRRWGLLSFRDGAYFQSGLMSLGLAGTAVDFRDSNKTIFIRDHRKVAAGFNAFEVNHASSNVEWTAISFQALGTVARGNFLAVDNAPVAIVNCTFTDMGTFGFLSNTDVVDSIMRRCGLITTGGATLTRVLIDSSYAAVALVTASPSLLDECTFVSDGTGHAIEATTAGDYNSNNTYTGYAATDGSTGNEAFYNNSGGHINLTVTGGTTPSVRNGSGATTTVIIPEVTVTIAAQVSLVDAEVRVYDLDTTPPDFGTELAGAESNAGATFAFSTGAANQVWIQIMKAGFVEYGQSFTVPAANTTLTVALKPELNA